MTRKRFRLHRCLAALAVFPMLLTLGGAVAVAKPTAKAATKHTPAAAEGSSSSDGPATPPAPSETPSAEPADSPSGTSTEITAADSTSTATATSTSASAAMETAEPINNKGQAKAVPDGERLPAEPPAPPPPEVEPIPATGVTGGEGPVKQNPAPSVAHLGPESFPGRLRGLYGGSLWIEPSFNGLQWPYMAHTGVGVSGMFWVDSGYEMIKRDLDIEKLRSSSMYFQQGRGVLRLTPTYVRGRFFVQGQAELVGNLCQTANVGNNVCNAGTFTTDDLWIRVGEWNLWDLKVGRFEGWEVYHLGMGMDSYTFERMGAGMFGVDSPASPALEAPSLYGVNYLHDRPTDGLAVGYAALHAYPTEYLRFELLAKLGTDNYQGDNSTGAAPSSYLGVRPTAIFDVGWFKLKIGAEYQKRTPILRDRDTATTPESTKDAVESLIRKGVGASVQFVVDPFIEFGLNMAIGRQHYTDSTGGVFARPDDFALSYTTKSVGGFVNLRLADLWLAGAGANWTEQTDSYRADGSNANDYTSHLQGFLALQHLLVGQLFIKAEVGFARAYFQPSGQPIPPDVKNIWSNYMFSGRIRLMYLY